MAADKPLVVIDTNVLLAATDRSRTGHASALGLLNEEERPLAITPQIVREYLVVATRPVEVNGLGMPARDAQRNIDELLTDVRLLEEGYRTVSTLRRIIVEPGASGKQIHDANVVAVALAHGATSIITANARHFERFSQLIAIEPLV